MGLYHLLFLVSACALVLAEKKDAAGTQSDVCETVFCGAGRECSIMADGNPTCVCKKECPNHNHTVCGSDGRTYENHCLMHRAACLKGVKITKLHKGPCIEVKKEDKVEAVFKTSPLVCYQTERDALRQLLIDWFRGKVQEHGWFRRGKNYTEVIVENFRHCDSNKDDKLNAPEFVGCVEKNETISNTGMGNTAHIIRGLCVDALIVMSDHDSDWELDLKEFQECLDPNFEPPKKKCSLENQTYEDGAETKVDCNKCVCACGNWVCTASHCDKKVKSTYKNDNIFNEPLPDKEERKALLEGFLASDEVDLDKSLLEEIASHEMKAGKGFLQDAEAPKKRGHHKHGHGHKHHHHNKKKHS